MPKKIKIKFAYCKFCKKEIEEPKRRPLDELEKTVWVTIMICTLGFAVPVFIIYLKYIRKRDTCPKCAAILEFSDKPFIKPPPLDQQLSSAQTQTSRQQVINRVEEIREDEKEKDKEKEVIYCSFCGEKISKSTVTCPYCQAAIKL